jgi:outer membrane lipoprotein-sorting protein
VQEDKTMIRSRTIFLYVPALVFLLSCAWNSCSEARAAKTLQDSQAMNFTVEGKINTLDHNKLTVHTEENIIFHVSYDGKTEFKSDDDSPASSKDLRVGLMIKVDGDLTESGEIVAQKILLEKSASKK